MRKFLSFLGSSPTISIDELLKSSSKYFTHFDELVEFGLWQYDVRNDKALWTEKMFKIFDMSDNKSPSFKKVLKRVHVDDQDYFEKWFKKVIREKKGCRIAYRTLDRNGELKFLDQDCDVVVDEDGTVIQLIGTTIDITEKRQTKEDFDKYIHKAQKISEVIESGVWSINVPSNSINFMSPRLSLISGYDSINLTTDQNTWRNIIHREDVKIYDERNSEIISKGIQEIEYRIIHKSGAIKWVRDVAIPTFDDNHNLISIEGVITDITNQVDYKERMAYLAYHDHLTGLPNRRLFDEKLFDILESSKTNGESFAIFYLDVDGFKRINDSLGHVMGDQVLEHFSERIKKTIPQNALLSRFGGDEFAIIIPNISTSQNSIEIAKRLIDNLQKPYGIDNLDLYVTASIGISIYPADGEDANTLIEKADIALYRAKEMGKNTYQLFMPSMNVETYKLYTLDQDLRKALERNEFTIHYQPKVNLKTGLMVGAEALIRWHHPEWKLVSAGEFIPLAEENGLIFPITSWVFRSVCEQLKNWSSEQFRPVPISINISPKLFLKVGWEYELLQIIEETSTDPTLLELEITESELIKNDESFIRSISLLKSYGIKISLDDFGTGYSSLFYLKQFDLDVLKIDRSLITPLDDKSLIIKAVIRLAHELDMKVVAEGVETQEQYEFLCQHECDQVQGYLFSKPLPSEEFIEFLKNPALQPTRHLSHRPEKENRKGFRIKTVFPLSGEMTIIKYKGSFVTMGSTKILIENIGIGGLRFMSTINLPVNPDILLNFKTEILGEIVDMTGSIVWTDKVGDFDRYGVQFNLDETSRQHLVKLLNKFAIQLRTNPVPANCSFMKDDIFEHLTQIRGS